MCLPLSGGENTKMMPMKFYAQEIAHGHPSFALRKSGIIIGEPSYLGASPDGWSFRCQIQGIN